MIQYLGNDLNKMRDIVGVDEVPSDVQPSSQEFVDEVEDNLPKNIPSSCDIILAIGIGMYIQALPVLARKTGAKAVIVPIENSGWYPLGILNQVKRSLEKENVEVAFPRPFCSLRGRGRKNIEKFVEEYGIGRPSIEAEVQNGEIKNVKVKTCAPCGSTETVANRIEGLPVSFEGTDILELEGRISEAHHSHPCTGDMMEDPILGETILHRAGYLVRDAVKKAVGLDLEPSSEEEETGKISEECPKLCGECVKVCETSGKGILEIEEDLNEVVIPNYEKCIGCRSCVKKCPIDVASKMVTKRDKSLLNVWEDAKLSN